MSMRGDMFKRGQAYNFGCFSKTGIRRYLVLLAINCMDFTTITIT